jgi:23S rRNA (uracil1939-C5)-methyltransferase
LYAGVGLFSVAAAVLRGAWTVSVEGAPAAFDDLFANATAAGAKLTAVRAAVEGVASGSFKATAAWPGRQSGFEVVIVDPPRTGMSPEALAGTLQLHAARLIYVSCDVATLARDARRIVDAGYVIDRADAFDLFPNTPHVETVVVFQRTSRT